MLKKGLYTLLVGASLVACITPHIARASSSVMYDEHTEIIKEQDPLSKAVRVSIVFTWHKDLAECRRALQSDSEAMPYLRPYLERGDITYQDLGKSFTLSIMNDAMPSLKKYLEDEVFGEDISYYMLLFKYAPSRPVLFKLPTDFNSTIYGLYNTDIPAYYRSQPQSVPLEQYLTEHFIGSGCKEGREYRLPSDFNADHYLALYPDLSDAATKQPDKMFFATAHYIQNGRHEGRSYLAPLPNDFSPYEYIVMHDDLDKASPQQPERKEAFAKEHYRSSGYFESRSFKISVPSDFSVATYLRLNTDVNDAYRKLPLSERSARVKWHFVTNAATEQRRYKD